MSFMYVKNFKNVKCFLFNDIIYFSFQSNHIKIVVILNLCENMFRFRAEKKSDYEEKCRNISALNTHYGCKIHFIHTYVWI